MAEFIGIKTTYAEDVFLLWKKLVQSSKQEIKIYTPYLDESINRLLKKVSPGVDVRIITRIDGDSFFERGFQVSSLINASEKGYKIFHLPELHAKMLMIDGNLVYLGSQNFTHKGRTNKEASIVSTSIRESVNFVERILDWDKQLVPVSIDLLKNLLKWEECNKGEIENLKSRLSEELNEIVEEHTQEEAQGSLIQTLINNSSIRLATEVAILVRQTIYGHPIQYYSLVAREFDNLISWIKKDKKGISTHYPLKWLYFYPAFNIPTNQLVFLRLAQTRITYVRNEALFDKPCQIGNISYKVHFNLPKIRTKFSNLKVQLTSEGGKQIILWFHFNGQRFKLKKERIDKSLDSIEFRDSFLYNTGKQKLFFEEYFSAFKYDRQLDFEERGITDFANSYRYELKIIEYGQIPIIVIRPC